jgi:multidrug resistance efflux pump
MSSVLVGGVWVMLRGSGEDDGEGPLLQTVARGPFEHIVLEQGEVESSNSVEIRSEVKANNTSGTAILEVVPEGTLVQQGDILVKLDSSALERERQQQQITVNTSEALVEQAKNAYESALIAKTEYLEGTLKQEEQVILNEIFVAEQNLKKAQLSYDSVKRLVSKGILTSLQLEGEQFAVNQAQNELNAANTKLNVLLKYTKEKMLLTLSSTINTSKVTWENEQKSHQVEQEKLAEIDDQIAKCTIRAPQAGQVVYANIVSSRGGNSEFVVEPGALVREKQVIVRLPDSKQMQVKAKINESRITMVKQGMPVSIRVDALGDVTLYGEVIKVNAYAEPGSWFSSQVKEYATIIRINEPPPQIRPGLTAEVRIHVQNQKDALQVPVQAIYETKGHTFCLVKKGAAWETRVVRIGASNDKTVTILSGLDQEEQVVMNPRRHSEKLDLPELPDTSPVQIVSSILGDDEAEDSSTAQAETAFATLTEGGDFGASAGMGDPSIAAGSILQRFDTDGDGKLSLEELSQLPSDRQAGFVGADIDGDGSIDHSEMMAVLAQRIQAGGGPPQSSIGGAQ